MLVPQSTPLLLGGICEKRVHRKTCRHDRCQGHRGHGVRGRAYARIPHAHRQLGYVNGSGYGLPRLDERSGQLVEHGVSALDYGSGQAYGAHHEFGHAQPELHNGRDAHTHAYDNEGCESVVVGLYGGRAHHGAQVFRGGSYSRDQ